MDTGTKTIGKQKKTLLNSKSIEPSSRTMTCVFKEIKSYVVNKSFTISAHLNVIDNASNRSYERGMRKGRIISMAEEFFASK